VRVPRTATDGYAVVTTAGGHRSAVRGGAARGHQPFGPLLPAG